MRESWPYSQAGLRRVCKDQMILSEQVDCIGISFQGADVSNLGDWSASRVVRDHKIRKSLKGSGSRAHAQPSGGRQIQHGSYVQYPCSKVGN